MIAVAAEGKNPEDITVVSGWKLDRDAAKGLTLPTQTPADFFASLTVEVQARLSIP